MPQKSSIDYKLERADQHLQSLKERIERWLATNPYKLTDEIDPNTSENVVRVKRVGRPPEVISLTLGDCLHNLRSVLDHIIYILSVKSNGGIALSDEIAREVSFPIFRSEAGFQARGKNRIRLIHPNAQTVVKSLQPLTAGNDYASHWLWLLSDMDNVDKHRTLVLAMIMPTALGLNGQPGIPTLCNHMYVRGLNPSDDNAEVARYTATLIGKPDQRVKMKFSAGTKAAFYDGAANGREVLQTMRGIRDYIAREVIPKFANFL